MTILLIDADYIIYKSCFSAETEVDYGDDLIVVSSKFSEAYRNAVAEIDKIKEALMADNEILFMSDTRNFRKSIDPDYKGHRNKKKPCGYKRVKQKLTENYDTVVLPELEGDDAIGIFATETRKAGAEDNIICSPDKDMKQIPGQLYDLVNPVTTITPEEGYQWFLTQTVAGDQTDGYSGVPGFGPKKAFDLFQKEGYTWEAVLKAYASKGLTESDAIRNARLARILQNTDYDFDTGSVKLWTPTPSSGTNTGAAV